ncbi:gamma-mobile-trio recombinase GmtY [Mesoterricola silvestris]|uniref:Integrase n=1 Tax=Mesoterricola silvestris TaxID=2927979 RepID=A0AA48KAD9_9BACT|nr:gamma-mobile-trio recombinase GmtY [Mesoterricola silvestris]BDU71423.1 integrase [Mesoterricola silvestris]
MFITQRVRVHTDNTGAYTEIPALRTLEGWLTPLLDYCLAHAHDRSLAWMTKVNRSVQLFLEYVQANPDQPDPRALFQNFAQRLYTGTFDLESGLDPSWLCWRPLAPSEAAKVITHLSDFFGWLGKDNPVAAAVNPRYAGSAYDRLADEAAYQFRRERAFLGHTWAANDTPNSQGRMFRARRPPRVERGEPPSFPEESFEDLLMEGFKVAGRQSYRDILITLLLHGAGFRESEPFHLYIGDVFPDPANPKRAMVLIHHPSFGDAPNDWKDERGNPRQGNRAAYLAAKFGLAPRHLLMGSRQAGWKGGTHDAPYYKRAYWFIPEFGELFLKVWYLYLEQVARVPRAHPFAFINLGQDPRGGIYGLSQYNKAHRRACERIGLVVGKALGTTPHGHRHAYGRRLVGGGFSQEEIRRFMHHSSLDSQAVYTTPTTAQMIEHLRLGAERLHSTLSTAVIPALGIP